MSKVTTILQYIITAIGTLSGLYATVKLGIYGMAHMEKNPQKVEQARDGLKNVAIGLLITIAAAAIVSWLKAA